MHHITAMKIDKYFDRKQKQYCWRFDFTLAGQRIRRGGFAKRVEAEKAVAALRLLSDRQAYGLPTGLPVHSVGDLLARLEQDPKLLSNRVVAFRYFAAVVGKRTPIVDLTRADLEKFLDHLQSRELRAATIRYYLALVSTYLRNVDRYFPAFENYRPPRFPPRPQITYRHRVLEQIELGKLFRALPEAWPGELRKTAIIRMKIFDVARLMLLTGARREEIVKIMPEHINRQSKTILLRSSKVQREHTIALSDTALEILDARIAITPEGRPLFDGLTNLLVTVILRRAAEQAGIPYGQQQNGGWSLHDCRRTAATIIEDAGIPYSAVMAQLGHKRTDMTARYTVPQMETLRRAALILENWCRDIDGFVVGSRRLQTSLEGNAK